MENKLDLLKILLDKPEQNPGTDAGQFYLTGTKEYTQFSRIEQKIIYNEYTIIRNSGYIFLFDKNGKQLFRSKIITNNVEYYARAITVDSEGNLYAIAQNWSTNEHFLFYLNNITIKNANGQYEIVVKKYYSLSSLLNDLNDANFFGMFWFTLNKSPYDSSFLITVDGNKYQSGIKNLAVIKYDVNFGADNDYSFLVAELPKQYGNTSSLFVSWTDENVTGTICSISSDTDLQAGTETNVSISKVNFNFSTESISQQLITTISNFISGEAAATNSSIVTDENTIYLIVQTHNTNYKTDIYKYVSSLDLVYGIGESTQRQYINAQYINRQLFFTLVNYQNSTYEVSFLHLVGNQMIVMSIGTISSVYIFFIITNSFNMYYINVCGKTGVYIYSEDSYNGTPYFSDKSVTPKTMTLYAANNSNPIFSRNLYNLIQVGNTITATLQIPANFLNEEIIGQEKLNSITNTNIADLKKEITKNIYEELYINTIESIKVYNKNSGSIYNQDSSIEIAKNIANGFESGYKITNFRIFYKDGTTSDKKISSEEIVDGIGIIHIYLYIDKFIDYIEVFDKNYTKSFLKIDMSEYEISKMYHIEQKIKIE